MKKLIKKLIKKALSPFIIIDFIKFTRQGNKRFKVSPLDFYPCVNDKTVKTAFDAHYVYHTCWAARKVKEIACKKHVDISSSLYFSGLVSAFVPVDFYDYRPADLKLSNLKSAHCDLNNLHFESESIKSLSCMHTVEHIGLGRYGDKIDAEGDLKAMKELERVLASDGSLLFVVPVGSPRIEYNAHRIYSYEMIISAFKNLKLQEFSMVNDFGQFIENANSNDVKNQEYACGCFWFKK